jgi:hypothetical protein
VDFAQRVVVFNQTCRLQSAVNFLPILAKNGQAE